NRIGKVLIPTQPVQWQVGAPDIGGLYNNVVSFFNIQNLTGGVGSDIFQFITTGGIHPSLSGKLAGGIVAAPLGDSQAPGVTVPRTGPGTAHGSMGTAGNIGGGFDNIDTIINNTGANVVIDDSANTLPTTWTITASGVTRQVQGQSAVTTDLSNPTFFS